MKKIFTLLFFAGVMTSAMAQNSRNGSYRNQNNNQANAYGNNGQGYTPTNQHSNDYARGSEYNQNNGYRQNEQGYNSQNGYGNERRFEERNDDRRFRGHERFDQRSYGYEGRRDFEHDNHGRFNARVAIRFKQAVCY